MSWGFVVVALLTVAFGSWVTLNPDKTAEAVAAARCRAGRGPWSTPEDLLPGRNELGLPTRPGYRVRTMRSVGIGAIIVGLGIAVLALNRSSS